MLVSGRAESAMMGILLARGGSLLRLTDGNGGGKGLVAGKEMGRRPHLSGLQGGTVVEVESTN